MNTAYCNTCGKLLSGRRCLTPSCNGVEPPKPSIIPRTTESTKRGEPNVRVSIRVPKDIYERAEKLNIDIRKLWQLRLREAVEYLERDKCAKSTY